MGGPEHTQRKKKTKKKGVGVGVGDTYHSTASMNTPAPPQHFSKRGRWVSAQRGLFNVHITGISPL